MSANDIPLSERLLDAIRKADPQHPMRLDQVALKLGECMEDLTAAAQNLYDARRINRCDRTCAGLTTTLIWPIGSANAPGKPTGAHLSWHFAPSRPMRESMRLAHAPRIQPKPAAATPPVAQPAPQPTPTKEEPAVQPHPAKKTRRSSKDVHDVFDAIISGRPETNPVRNDEIAAALGYKSPNMIGKMVKHWLDVDDGATWVGVKKVSRALCYYDKEATPAATPAPAAAAESPAPKPATAPGAERLHQRARDAYAQPRREDAPRQPVGADEPAGSCSFALWDDGRLSVYNGDDHIEIAPVYVKRLAVLLGVAA